MFRHVKRKKSMKKEIEKSCIIKAEYIRETKDSWLLDCEGDVEWFPKSEVYFDKDKQELELPKWLYQEKFPNEQF